MSDKEKPESPQPAQPAKPAKGQPQKKRVTVEMSKDINAVYANAALIDFSPAEVVIDFIQMLPRMPKAQVKSRVLLSPIHAKLLQKALAQHVAKYERQFGTIRMPTQSILADEFFKMSQRPDDDKEKGKGDNE